VGAGKHGSIDSSERVVRLVAQIFNAVDKEGCGLISLEDLKRAIKLRSIAQLFKEVGINIEDLKAFFSTLDDDRSGFVTVDEMIQGLLSMKKSLKELERSIAYLRKVFKQADTDQSGTLTESDFWRTSRVKLSGPTCTQWESKLMKLMKFGQQWTPLLSACIKESQQMR